MNINNMTSNDYLNLFLLDKSKTSKLKYEDWQPTSQSIDIYNNLVARFKNAWEKDKSQVHKYIAITSQAKELKEDNNFKACMEVGHKWELYIDEEFKKCGVDIGMYYDNRQFKGENDFGIEIKHDGKAKFTPNIYIEYEALSKDETKFINGGITKEDNSKYWLIGNEDEGYYIFYKKDLYKIYEQIVIKHQKVDGCKIGTRRTSKGILINKQKAKEIMIADNIQEFLIKIGKICI